MAVLEYRPDALTVEAVVPASTAIAVGDLMYYDTGSENFKPASSQADAGSEALNQRNFAKAFAGISIHKRITTQATAGVIALATDLVALVDAVSADFDIGDLVAITENSGGDGLENQKVKKVTDPSLAIGVVVENTGTSTRVWVRFTSKVLTRNKEGIAAGSDVSSTATTASGTVTLTVDSNMVQAIDPGGAGRNVVLPNEAASKNKVFIIHNTADAAEVLTIKASDGSTTICTPTQNEAAFVYCDGTSWRGLVGANN